MLLPGWNKKWQSTPVFLPGKSHGQRGLVGYNPWGWNESDTTERTDEHREMPQGAKALFFRGSEVVWFWRYTVTCRDVQVIQTGGWVLKVVEWLLREPPVLTVPDSVNVKGELGASVKSVGGRGLWLEGFLRRNAIISEVSGSSSKRPKVSALLWGSSSVSTRVHGGQLLRVNKGKHVAPPPPPPFPSSSSWLLFPSSSSGLLFPSNPASLSFFLIVFSLSPSHFLF